MTTGYLGRRKPRQLDIIADTDLSKTFVPYLTPGPLAQNRGDLSTAPEIENGGDLSTAAPPKNRGDLSTARAELIRADLSTGGMKRLDARRKATGMSIAKLCAAAGVHPNTYEIALKGKSVTRVSTYRKLADAMRRFATGEKPEAPGSVLQSMIRILTIRMAEEVGADPTAVLATNFASENTNDPVWLQASRLRRAAIYVAVEGAGVSKAAVGHAIGISRQAVFKAVAVAEMERDRDEEFNRLMRQMIVTAGKNW